MAIGGSEKMPSPVSGVVIKNDRCVILEYSGEWQGENSLVDKAGTAVDALEAILDAGVRRSAVVLARDAKTGIIFPVSAPVA